LPFGRYLVARQRNDAANNRASGVTVSEALNRRPHRSLEVGEMMGSAPDAKRHCVLSADPITGTEVLYGLGKLEPTFEASRRSYEIGHGEAIIATVYP
jgi:hypothetical protein